MLFDPGFIALVTQGELAVVCVLSLAAGLCAMGFAIVIAYPSLVRVVQRQRSGVLPGSAADALVGDCERESGLSASIGGKVRSQSTQLVSTGAVDAGTSFSDAIESR